jgi:hypothetical protein
MRWITIRWIEAYWKKFHSLAGTVRRSSTALQKFLSAGKTPIWRFMAKPVNV